MPSDSPDLAVQQDLLEVYKTISNGNLEALQFCIAWQHYCHNIDDQVDRDNPGNLMCSAEEVAANYFNAFCLYNSPFWVKNKDLLFILIPVITSDYIDSCSLQNTNDHLRSCGNTMLKAVAYICGGWVLLRQVSPILNKFSDKQQR
jgi:hypothetical protein